MNPILSAAGPFLFSLALVADGPKADAAKKATERALETLAGTSESGSSKLSREASLLQPIHVE
jgi:hypothetical protein